MTELELDIEGLDEAIQKMSGYADKFHTEMYRNMQASLDVLNESVPPYPPKPETSKYRRTGTLGRSLGSGMSGGKTGAKPTVYGISQSMAGGGYEGRFGTNLSYAKYVIDPQTQAYMHKGHWWTMDNVKESAKTKILKIWQDMVKFILGK